MSAYYNEHDKYCAAWLRNLIAANLIALGDVDERSIVDVRPDDLAGYTQCHFFAGIGGWSYAARLAGWPDDLELWTGSCPCQPFSLAGKRKGFDDARHLWPAWRDLIRECAPTVVFGEQVASATDWLGLVRSDLEAMGFAVGAIPVEAASAGADRFWLVADAAGNGRQGIQRRTEAQVQENWTFEALAAWHAIGDPFANWRQLMAGADVRCLADGVSSFVAVRPSLRAFGNAIDPRPAAQVIGAYLDLRLAA